MICASGVSTPTPQSCRIGCLSVVPTTVAASGDELEQCHHGSGEEEASRAATRKRRNQHHGDLEHRVNRAMTRSDGGVDSGETRVGRSRVGARH